MIRFANCPRCGRTYLDKGGMLCPHCVSAGVFSASDGPDSSEQPEEITATMISAIPSLPRPFVGSSRLPYNTGDAGSESDDGAPSRTNVAIPLPATTTSADLMDEAEERRERAERERSERERSERERKAREEPTPEPPAERDATATHPPRMATESSSLGWAIAAVSVVLLAVAVFLFGGREYVESGALQAPSVSTAIPPEPQAPSAATPPVGPRDAPTVTPDPKAKGQDPSPALTLEPRPTDDAPPSPKAERLVRNGMRAFKRRRLKKALSYFERAEKEDDNFAEAHRGLGLVFDKLGRKRRAKRAYRRYLKLAPTGQQAARVRRRLRRL